MSFTKEGASYKFWCQPDTAEEEWEFDFPSGYIDRKYVKLRYLDESGVWQHIAVHPVNDWADDTTLAVKVPPSFVVEVYRDTPKNAPIVTYGFGGSKLARESMQAAALQAIHIVEELSDSPTRELAANYCGL